MRPPDKRLTIEVLASNQEARALHRAAGLHEHASELEIPTSEGGAQARG